MIVDVPVRDVMISPVETVTPGDTAMAVARRLSSGDLGSLVVVDDGQPVGIVTETDLVGLLADGRDPGAVTVGEFMSSPLITVDPDEDVVDAAELATHNEVEKLPVVEDGRLVGIVTVSDLLDYLPELARKVSGPIPEIPAESLPDVRTDTTYERRSWEFRYDAAAPDSVSLGDTASFSKVLSDEDLRSFADATGDTNRLHLDEDFAARTRFGRRIAHGALVTGVISAALARLPGLVIYISQDFQFLAPVDVGDRVTAVCEVVADLEGDRFRLSVTVRDADEVAVVTGSATVLIDPMPELDE